MERSQDSIHKLLDSWIGLSHPTVYSRKLENKVKAKAMKVDTQRRHSIAPGEIADAVSPSLLFTEMSSDNTVTIWALTPLSDLVVFPAIPSANSCFSAAATDLASFATSCKFCQFNQPITSAEMVSTLSPP